MATLIEEIISKEALAALDKIISGLEMCAQAEQELRILMPDMPELECNFKDIKKELQDSLSL